VKGSFDARDFVAGFIAEAGEHLSASTANLLSIEAAAAQDQATPRQVRELFRSFHTIKGLAAMVGIEPVVEVAHAMEAVLREADRAAGRLPAGAVEVLLRGVAAIEHRVQALAQGHAVPASPAPLLEALGTIRAGAAGGGTEVETSLAAELSAKLSVAERTQLGQGLLQGRRGVVLEFMPTPERAARGVTITSVRERVAELAEIVKVVPRALPASPEAPGGLSFALVVLTDRGDEALAEAVSTTVEALTPVVVTSAPASVEIEEADGGEDLARRRGLVRVEVARLDETLERLSALVVTQFRLSRAVAELRAAGTDVRDLARVVGDQARQLRDLRASVMRARMVSVEELLERIPLVVRGLARATGKEARLVMKAGHAELDKTVAEKIFPAIVHLVRNAVDHALETPAERRAAGKHEAGVLTVACHDRSDSQLELTISDDGRGVDAAAVARRAGVPVPATNEALLALLARPGLSTKTEVTTTSGRGVGMDVVKRITVDELHGELTMVTIPGQGTTFSLIVPLSITIVDAFSFMCGGENFVVPVSLVEEIQDLDLGRTVRGPDRRQTPRGGPDRRAAAPRAAEMIHRRGEAVPVLRLEELMGLGHIAELRRKAIIVRRNGAPFAFAVDRMLGQHEVVVRPLEDALVRVHGISGTTDLGDGRPTLVLDLAALGGRLLEDVEVVPS
jgi:two-component system, chemotaxis family, sensor kinase CheA